MKNIKDYLSPIFALSTLTLLALLFHTCERKRDRENSLKSVIIEKNREMKIRRTKDSLTIADKDKAILSSVNDALKYYGTEMAELKKQGEYSNAEMKALKSFIKATFEASTSGVTPVITNNYYDSGKHQMVQARSASFKDSHFNIHAVMLPDRAIWDTVQYRATFTAAGFQRTKWFKTRTYLNAYLDDKNAAVTGMTNFELKEVKDRRFGLGPAVIYDPFKNSFSIGVGLHYDLIKF